MRQITALIHDYLIPAVHAQGIGNPALDPVIGGPTIDGGEVLGKIVSALVGIFLIAGFIFTLLHLMFGAFRWITASGDKAQLQNAQERITQALVGLIIMVAVWAIMLLFSEFLGIDFPNITLPTVV